MIRRLLRAHGDLLIGAAALCVGVFMACVLGPTLDAQSTLTACEGCGKTAVAARQP
ncbi:hypothetical protein LMG26788_03742 [Achromobacter pulmonis]|uniref:Uncharacterized protein n=1 Tax=Achromobacter pulmonis TaxID=1389932 RepID=A0A6S7DD78_9BURK|nr:hypothetical protein [Achromobacter pulmonis]CAB3889035.1 hypothetical protein LMG26788_03676 [Achromobacter pulmonis]CAB3890333.1 hypothetical protein LMG26788_03742 [Achromobacter pulmonis]